MLRKLINKLKIKKKHLLELNKNNEEKLIEKTFDIIIYINTNEIFVVDISDYITGTEYFERMQLIDNYGVLKLISNNILWNSSKQCINKGTYYVKKYKNRLYNILINQEKIMIDERVKKNEITEERIMTFLLDDKDYSYRSLKHDKEGSTFYTKFYNKKGVSLKNLALSKYQTFIEFDKILKNIEIIYGMNEILNINLLKFYILDDLNKKNYKMKTLKNNL